MKTYLFLFILFLATKNQIQCQEITCIKLENLTLVRTFESLDKYQGNKLRFDPGAPEYEGNQVDFSCQSISNLPKMSFKAFDSEHVWNLILANKSIERIDEGAFTSLFCLERLDLSGNRIKELTWKMFEGIENLRQLDLSHNMLESVADMVFIKLERLEVLILAGNKIKKVSSFAFMKLEKLQILNLRNNELSSLPNEVFESLHALKTFDLSFNKFQHVTAQKWDLPTLKNLDLSSNQLRSFDLNYKYAFIGLQSLNLSSNLLSDLNTRTLRLNFPNMASFDIEGNNWFCETLTRIVHELADSKIEHSYRNVTNTSEDGIDCTTVKGNYTTSEVVPEPDEEALIQSPTSTENSITKQDSANIKDIQLQNMELLLKNSEMTKMLSSLKSMVTFLVVLIILLIVVNVVLKAGLCQTLVARVTNRTFVDTGRNLGQENYSLFHP